MNRLLDLARPEQAGEVRQFLEELPQIRSRRLAFNRGATFTDAFVVATTARARRWSDCGDQPSTPQEADRLDDVGEQLKEGRRQSRPQIPASHRGQRGTPEAMRISLWAGLGWTSCFVRRLGLHEGVRDLDAAGAQPLAERFSL
jgi:hypothetical protein